MNIKDIDLVELIGYISDMHIGSLVGNYFRKCMQKEIDFERNITFFGAVVYANRMEE